MANVATNNGGGIHAIGSFIKLVNWMNIMMYWVMTPIHRAAIVQCHTLWSNINNRAKKGGGVYLESCSKLYILKNVAIFFHLTFLMAAAV